MSNIQSEGRPFRSEKDDFIPKKVYYHDGKPSVPIPNYTQSIRLSTGKVGNTTYDGPPIIKNAPDNMKDSDFEINIEGATIPNPEPNDVFVSKWDTKPIAPSTFDMLTEALQASLTKKSSQRMPPKIGSLPSTTKPGMYVKHKTLGDCVVLDFVNSSLLSQAVVRLKYGIGGARETTIRNKDFILTDNHVVLGIEDIRNDLAKPVPNYNCVNYVEPGENKYRCDVTFYKIGVMNGDVFMDYKRSFYNGGVFEILKFNEDVVMYIPRDFCHILKYNEAFVMSYVDVIRSFGFGDIEYKGIEKLEGFSNYTNGSTNNTLINDEFYTFYIKSELSQNKFLIANLLRMLGDSDFYGVAGIFMQFRDLLSSEGIGDWQLLTLALLFQRNPNTFILYPTRSYDIAARQRYCFIPNIFSYANTLEAFKEAYDKVNLGKEDLSITKRILMKESDFFGLLEGVRSNRDFSKLLFNYKKLML